MDALLASNRDLSALGELPLEPLGPDHQLLAPIESQEVWACGVTFLESKYAREAESRDRNVYRAVYDAARPELFLKATPGTVVGPTARIGIRHDSTWDVPEPELGLVVTRDATVAAYTIGNDVSSRSIEGENPLYLPQAKIYENSCSIGPCLVPTAEAPPVREMHTELAIERGGTSLWSGRTPMSDLKRSLAELVEWLFLARSFPRGVILLTGTGLVPDDSVTLAEGDQVRITISGIGTLNNVVTRVGTGEPAPTAQGAE